MSILYVVRNSFKAHGKLYEVGDIIDDPSSIKLFRSRVAARDIVELSESKRDCKAWFEYLQARSKKELDPRIYTACGIQAPKVVESPKPAAPATKPVASTVKPATKPVAPKPAVK